MKVNNLNLAWKVAGIDPYMLAGVSGLQQPPPVQATPLGLEFRSLQGAAAFDAAAAAAQALPPAPRSPCVSTRRTAGSSSTAAR